MLPVLLNDGVEHPEIQQFLKGWLPTAVQSRRWRGWQISVVAYALMTTMLGSQTVSELKRYRGLEPVKLPGALLLRADHRTVQLYHWAVGELGRCPAFYSLPNISTTVWTNQQPPTRGFSTTIL